MSAYFFFFLKCPPLFIKLHSSHDEIRRGPSHPFQVFQSHVSFYGARYSRLLGKDKGHSALATGDFTHPEWLFLLKQKLEPTGNGFFCLKNIIPSEDEYLKSFSISPKDISFILSTEISFIYSKNGKVRKIHLLILSPDFESVDKINQKLSGLGNLRSDGRPNGRQSIR